MHLLPINFLPSQTREQRPELAESKRAPGRLPGKEKSKTKNFKKIYISLSATEAASASEVHNLKAPEGWK